MINDARSRLVTVYCLDSINRYPTKQPTPHSKREQVTLYRMSMILLNSIDDSVVDSDITDYLDRIDDDVVASATGNDCPICQEKTLDFDVNDPLKSTCCNCDVAFPRCMYSFELIEENNNLVTKVLTHSLLLTHLLTRLLTHSLTYSLTHSLTHYYSRKATTATYYCPLCASNALVHCDSAVYNWTKFNQRGNLCQFCRVSLLPIDL